MGIEFVMDEQDKRKAFERQQMRARRADRTALKHRDHPDEEYKDGADPAFRFKWINGHERAYQRALDSGFEVVPQDSPTVPRRAKWNSEKAAYMLDGLVLMRESRAEYEEKRADANDRFNMQSIGYTEEAKENINRTARDAGRAPAHKDAAFDVSEEGRPVTIEPPETREAKPARQAR